MPVLAHQYYSERIKKAKPWHVKHAMKIWAALYAALIIWSQN